MESHGIPGNISKDSVDRLRSDTEFIIKSIGMDAGVPWGEETFLVTVVKENRDRGIFKIHYIFSSGNSCTCTPLQHVYFRPPQVCHKFQDLREIGHGELGGASAAADPHLVSNPFCCGLHWRPVQGAPSCQQGEPELCESSCTFVACFFQFSKYVSSTQSEEALRQHDAYAAGTIFYHPYFPQCSSHAVPKFPAKIHGGECSMRDTHDNIGPGQCPCTALAHGNLCTSNTQSVHKYRPRSRRPWTIERL